MFVDISSFSFSLPRENNAHANYSNRGLSENISLENLLISTAGEIVYRSDDKKTILC